jgi:acyl carrier protein
MTVREVPTAGSLTATVLSEVSAMIVQILDKYGLGGVEIEMGTLFHDDLEMESIDLVTLAGMLAERYGEHVNLAEYLAEKDLDEVIGLTIGDVVTFVVDLTGDVA